jgi:methylenetetrahydrofolate reductase (NADPH)
MVVSPFTLYHDGEKSVGLSKVTDKLGAPHQPSVSFEYFPPKTDSGVESLQDRVRSMCDMNPAWIDVTFGAGGSTSNRTLGLCKTALSVHGLDVMMHLTCTNMDVSEIDEVLERIKESGLRNILALRGDPPKNESEWTQCHGGFRYAVDLVRHIRSKYGDHFCVAVAGYPEGHADSVSFEADLKFLKEKVDAGADMIVTQLFYDVDKFEVFLEKLRGLGVTVPVIPGIMPILSYSGLQRMCKMCKVHLPLEIAKDVEDIKDDERKIKEYGIKLAVRMCRRLINSGVRGIHIYTMNQEEGVREIVKNLADVLPEKHTNWIGLSTAS